MLSRPKASKVARRSLASKLEAVATAGDAVRDFARAAGLEIEAAQDLELATVEAANNIVVHGYKNTPDHRYSLSMAVRGSEVQILLSDGGEEIPAERFHDVSPEWSMEAESGRGWAIIRACTDRIEYCRVRGRNRLLLVKRR